MTQYDNQPKPPLAIVIAQAESCTYTLLANIVRHVTHRDHTQPVGTFSVACRTFNLEILGSRFVVGLIWTFGMTVNRRDRPMVEDGTSWSCSHS